MAIQKRNSVLALKVETTEGTPVIPTAATDFIAIQDDLSIDPAFDTLENAELNSSLGKSKSILGLENPSASFSHYLRHSGVEGQAPNFKQLLKAVWGSESVRAVERDTIAASTTTVIKVNVGEGSEFPRGSFLLIKDGTNGYSIRPVHSVSTDDLTIGFKVDTAPASGVNLGKDVNYKPLNSGHQSLTLWHYVGNGGAVEAIAGARVTDTSFTFGAGELINASYSLEGMSYYFDPINITSADRYLDFTDDNGTFAAVITAKLYKDPHDLASALTTAMNTADPLETFSVTYSDTTGKFTIATSTSALLSLLWNTGTNTANTVGDKIGFSVAANDTGATSYLSDNAQSFAAPYTPSFDSSDPLVAKNNVVYIGDQDDNVCFDASSVEVTVSTPKADILSICEESGRAGAIINERTVTVSVTALLEQYDADKFARFRQNTETRFLYNFGIKSGGNWVPGKCGGLYLPTATITSFNLADEDGLVTLEMELTSFVNSSGEGEVYLGFV